VSVRPEALLARARSERLALMCAERAPAQCHRNLIADFLLAQGAEVIHLLDESQAAHRLSAHARIASGALVYDVGSAPALF
jgi:uncharacterized protein (DUF488 family)